MLSRSLRLLLAATAAGLVAACANGDEADRPFLEGTTTDPGIAIAVGSIGTTLHMLQTGNPDAQREIPLGTSSTVTAVGFSIRGRMAAVPLGNAASVALVNLETESIERYFTFPSGNATGSAWVDDRTVIACNQLDDVCGRFTVDQANEAMTLSGVLTPFPTAVVTFNGRVFVVSSNLDDNYVPAGPGVVTELNPTTLEVVRTFTVGLNPQYGGIASNGTLYVVNSGDFGTVEGSLSVIDLNTNTVDGDEVTGFGSFPGPIDIDANGRIVVSSFSYGSVVWNSLSGAFIRPVDDPVCAPDAGGCRTASSASFAPNGKLYQAFFGSAAGGQPAYYFVYNGATFALEDSIPVPIGPAGLEVVSFE